MDGCWSFRLTLFYSPKHVFYFQCVFLFFIHSKHKVPNSFLFLSLSFSFSVVSTHQQNLLLWHKQAENWQRINFFFTLIFFNYVREHVIERLQRKQREKTTNAFILGAERMTDLCISKQNYLPVGEGLKKSCTRSRTDRMKQMNELIM